MGQKIEVTTTVVGDVALFDLDRSLTGQDGLAFDHAPANPDGPPALLAQRLFRADQAIASVYVLSNLVSVRRPESWTDEAVAEASRIVSDLFLFYEVETEEERIERLRAENYNATITSIQQHNPDLWIMKLKPDEPIDPFKPGQYTTLGLGFWEPRVDDELEDFEADPDLRYKMARRSYSVSNSIIDENGELEETHPDEVEFYIVLVPLGEEEIPALTRRIWAKTEGDRIYMSHKFTGRYTLDGVEPTDNVVFLATGTGEAPNNTMIAELLRRQHQGQILSAVTVRYRKDLGYLEQNQAVAERYSNYTYLPLTTREPENEGNKVYIQDLITSGQLEEELGEPLDPDKTHVYLCGNPAMIGLPKWDDEDRPEFPEPLGVAQILHERGFTLDHRRDRGNLHYEEYWKE